MISSIFTDSFSDDSEMLSTALDDNPQYPSTDDFGEQTITADGSPIQRHRLSGTSESLFQNSRMMVFKNGEIAAMKDAVAQWANGDM
jgi:hypothetical protein